MALFAKALLAFIVLPGIVAFAIPISCLLATDRSEVVQPFGLIPLIVGCVGLAWCVRDFYIQGKGTLAPWSPPANLVVVGLYRFTRNPMYVAVTFILLGWSVSYGVAGLYVYTILVITVFHLRVVLFEEPWLARKYEGLWIEYAQRVPRWFW
ncbi:hypothetical protein BTA51_09275 [Hahella sp. CCB-MM4]|uniref:methyltransferase family protein n=1 Tax=Hahella sp. (strain CCB-MM4) TaxID=1926491 RepID=UPI000BC661E4|nr:isoprenylcysteine carboxylmethyltransferase family protein [Hahella sp. CCB-MM4]OZG73960.1 hypothetical protein BTA51_09275 [Hahella sp. CCB-MM4]